MKKKIIFLSIFILVLLIGGVAIFYFTQSNRDSVTFADEEAKYKTYTEQAPTDGSLPSDHDSLSNIAYVLWVLENTENYFSQTKGSAVSAGQTQEILNQRFVNGSIQVVNTYSGGLVTLGKQKYFQNGKVLIRDFTSKDGDNISWKTDQPECITNKGYITRYGWLPNQATAYIICKETILEISETQSLENGLYSLTLTLNPDREHAPFWYRREVATNASSLDEPAFSSIVIEYIFDAQWRVQEVKTQEKYTVKPKVAPIPVVCETNLTEVFNYETYKINQDDLDFFEQYKDLTPSDGEVEPEETTPLSYITGSLLGGNQKEKTFDVLIQLEERKLQGKLALNISDLNNVGVKLALGDLQIIFENNTVYIDYNSIKVKGNVDEVSTILEPLLRVILLKDSNSTTASGDSSFDVGQIMNDINNATIQETEESVTLDLALNLMGLKLPLRFLIAKDGKELDLLSIQSTILTDPYLSVHIEKNEAIQFKPMEGNYSDLKDLEFLIQDITEILENKKMSFTFMGAYQEYQLSGKVNMDFAQKLVKLEIELQNQALGLKEKAYLIFDGSVVYVQYRNIKVQVSATELEQILNQAMGGISTPQEFDINAFIQTIFELDFGKLLQNLTITESQVSLTLNLSQLISGLDIVIFSIEDTAQGFKVETNLYDITIDIDTKRIEEIHFDKTEYSSIKEYSKLIEYLLSKLGKESLELLVDGIVEYGSYQIGLTGNLHLYLNEGRYGLEGTIGISYDNQQLEVKLIYWNEELYLSVWDYTIKLSITTLKDTITKITEQLGLPQVEMPELKLGLKELLEIVETIKLTENQVELDLSRLTELLGKIGVSFLIKEDTLTGTIRSGIFNGTIQMKGIETKAIETPKEYYDEEDILEVTKYIADVLEVIRNKRVGFSFGGVYEGIGLKGSIYVDWNTELQAKGTIEVEISGNQIEVEIYYKEGNLYISNKAGIKVYMSLEEAIELIKPYLPKDLNVGELELNRIPELLEGLTIEKGSIEILLNMSQWLEGLEKLRVSLTKTETGFKVETNLYDITIDIDTKRIEEIHFDKTEYSSIKEYSKLIEYLLSKLGKESLELLVDGIVEYGSYQIGLTGNLHLYLNEGRYGLEGTIGISYDNQQLEVKLIYWNEELYLSVWDYTIKLSITTLKDTITKITEQLGLPQVEMPELKLGLKELLEIVETIKLTENQVELDLSRLTELLGKIGVSFLIKEDTLTGTIRSGIFNGTIQMKGIETKAIETPKEYYDEEDILEVTKYIADVLEVIRNKRVGFSFGGVYEGIGLKGSIYVDWNTELQAKGTIEVEISGNQIEVEIYYKEGNLYISNKAGIKVYMSLEEAIELIKPYLPKDLNVGELELNRIPELLEGLTIEKGSIEILLNMSQWLEGLEKLRVSLTKTETGFKVETNLYDITIDIDTKRIEEIHFDKTEFVSCSKYLEQIKYFLGLLYKDSIHMGLQGSIDLSIFLKGNLENLSMNIQDTSYLDFVFCNGKYGIDGKLDIEIFQTKHQIRIQFLEGILYVSYGSLSIEIAMAELPKLFQQIEETFGFVLPELNTNEMMSMLLPIFETIFLKEDSITLDVSSLIKVISFITLQFTSIMENGNILGTKLEIISAGIQLEANISASSKKEMVLPEDTVQLEDIQQLISLVGDIKDSLEASNGLSMQIDVELYGIRLTGLIQMTKNWDIYANLWAKIKAEDGTEQQLPIDIYYINQKLYFNLNGIKLVFEEQDFHVIMDTIQNLIGPLSLDLSAILSSLKLDFENFRITEVSAELDLVLDILSWKGIRLSTQIQKDEIRLSSIINQDIQLHNLSLTFGLTELPKLGEYLPVSNLVSMFQNLERGVSSTGQLSLQAMGYDIVLPYQMQFKLDLINLLKGQDVFEAIELELVVTSEFYSPITLTIVDGILYLDSMDTKYKYELPKYRLTELFASLGEQKPKLEDIVKILKSVIGYATELKLETTTSGLTLGLSEKLVDTLQTMLSAKLGLELTIKDAEFVLSNLGATTADFNLLAAIDVLGMDVSVELSTKTTASDYVSHLTEEEKLEFVLTTDFKDHPFAKRVLDIMTMVKGLTALDYSGNGQKFDLNIPLEVDNGLIKSCVVTGDLGVALDLQGILDGNDIWSSFKLNAKINIKAETKLFVKININVWLFYIGDGYLYLIVDGNAAGINFKIAEMMMDLKSMLAEGLGTSSDEVTTIYLNDLLNRVMNGFTTEQSGNKTTLVLAPAAVEVVNTLWRSLVDLANEQIAALNVSALTSLINSIANFNMDVTGFTLNYIENDLKQMESLQVVLSGYRHGTYTKTALPITITASGALDATYFDAGMAKANDAAYLTAKSEMATAREMVNALGEFRYTPEFYAQAKEVQAYLDSMSELAKASYSSTYPSEMISYYEILFDSEEKLKQVLIDYASTGLSGLNYDTVLGCYDAYLYFRKQGIVLTEEEFDLYLSIYNTMALESLLDFANRVESFTELDSFDFEANKEEILVYKEALNMLYNEYYSLSSSYKDAFKSFYFNSYQKLMRMIEAYDKATSVYVNERIYSYVAGQYTLEEAQAAYTAYQFTDVKNFILDHSAQSFAWNLLTDFIYMNYVYELDKEIGKAIEGGILPELVVTIPELEEKYSSYSTEFKAYFKYSMDKLRTMLEPAKVKYVEVVKELLDQFELARLSVNYGVANAQKAYYYDYTQLSFTEDNYSIGVSLIAYFGYASEEEILSWFNDSDAFTKFKILAYSFEFIKSVRDNQISTEELQAKFAVLEDSSKNYYYTKYVTGIWGSKKVHNETHSYAEVFTRASSGLAYDCYQLYLQRLNA